MTLYFDEDVSMDLARLLRRNGFVVASSHEEGNNEASDAFQLAYASHRNWTLVTHNRRNFEKLALEWAATDRHHAGIIALVRRPVADLARRLETLLQSTDTSMLADIIVYR